jgi:hypothetical protein
MERFESVLVPGFALLALLSAIDLYARSYLVSEKTSELGLRLALGTSGSRILLRVVEISGALAPISNFFQTIGAGVFEQAYAMAGMFEFVDVSPDFCLPRFVVDGRFAAAGTTGVQLARLVGLIGNFLKFQKHAADFLDVFVFADDVLVP